MALKTVTKPAEAEAEAGEATHEHRIKPAGGPVFATLTRGQTYSLRVGSNGETINFTRGVPVQITPAQQAHLAEFGVDDVTEKLLDEDTGRESNVGVKRPKFKFSNSPAAA